MVHLHGPNTEGEPQKVVIERLAKYRIVTRIHSITLRSLLYPRPTSASSRFQLRASQNSARPYLRTYQEAPTAVVFYSRMSLKRYLRCTYPKTHERVVTLVLRK